MSSEFEFTGVENQQAGFRDRTTGTQHWANVDYGSPVDMLDGDEVQIITGGQRVIWSIREQRIARYE